MQYRYTLPADYDMDIIRRRIVAKGHLLDDFPGLAFKAYLYAAGRENLYAPFYLWHDTESMNAFLGSAGFAGLADAFGRPAIRVWSAWHADVARDLSAATYATREIAPIAAHASLHALRDEECSRAQADTSRGALASISAFEPSTWTLLRFRLWRTAVERPKGDDADAYDVGHVSQPRR